MGGGYRGIKAMVAIMGGMVLLATIVVLSCMAAMTTATRRSSSMLHAYMTCVGDAEVVGHFDGAVDVADQRFHASGAFGYGRWRRKVSARDI